MLTRLFILWGISIMNDLQAILLPLIEARRQQTAIRDAAQIEVDRLSTEIGVAMACENATTVVVGDYSVSLREQARSTLSKDLLVELGVGTDIIQQATKESRYTVVHVRAIGKKDVAA